MVSNNYQDHLQPFRLLPFPILPGTSFDRAYAVWRQDTKKEPRQGVIFIKGVEHKP
jgi:hypothetical protein